MLKRAVRGLLRSPAFIASVVLTLALAVMANLTVMSLLSATVLREPPVKDPDNVVVALDLQKNDSSTAESVSSLRYAAWRSSPAFESSAALRLDFANILWDRGAKRVSVARVTPDFFKVLGTAPEMGATFAGGDSEETSLVISHRLWIQEFGGDPAIIGKTVSSESRSYSVVAVMPPEFRIPLLDPEAWVPLQDEEWKDPKPGPARLQVLARLSGSMNGSQAEQALAAVSLSLPAEPGQQKTDSRPRVLSLRNYIVESAGIKPVVRILMGAMILVLLIACINVSHLLFVRMSAKTADLALQLSLGATKRQLLVGVVYESVLIAAASVALGILLSLWSIQILQSRLTFNDYVAALQLRLDGPTLWLSMGILLALATLLSAIPGAFLRAIRTEAILRESGRGVLLSRRKARVGAVLVVMQAVSASILLVLTSAMLVKFIVAKHAAVGFDSSGVMVARLTLDRFQDPAHRSQFIHSLLERLSNQVGVQSVTGANSLPMLGGGFLQVDLGRQGTQWQSVRTRLVSPGFFSTLKIPVLLGADLPEQVSVSDRPIVVSDVFATRFLRATPLGQTVRLRANNNSPALSYRVIGVVGNTKHWLGEPGDSPDVYRAYSEVPSVDAIIAIRSSLEPASLVQIIRNVVRALEPAQPIDSITTYRNALEMQQADDVVLIAILIFIATLALILASLGIYGVLSYTIQMRRREFGLRLALGSTPSGLTWRVLKTSALLMGAGAACGLILTPILIRLLDSVFRGKVTHVGVIVLVVLFVETLSILSATWAPARKASRVDPIDLLRSM